MSSALAMRGLAPPQSAATKVRVPTYNHALKCLQQELIDELTDQGVILVPQEHDIIVQSVCH